MASFITLQAAETLTHTYQRSSIAQNQTIAGFSEADKIQQLLDQSGCDGIRIYLSLNASGKLTFVLVGVDSNGDDIIPGDILDALELCPPYCPGNSPLIL